MSSCVTWPHDIVDSLLTGFPGAALREAIEQVHRADGLIAVTPIFSASYSGLFKSFFDVLDHGRAGGQAGTHRGDRRDGPALARPGARDAPAVRLPARRHVPTAVFAATEDWGAAGGDTGTDDSPPGRPGRPPNWPPWPAARRPAAEADPFSSVTPFDQLLHGH